MRFWALPSRDTAAADMRCCFGIYRLTARCKAGCADLQRHGAATGGFAHGFRIEVDLNPTLIVGAGGFIPVEAEAATSVQGAYAVGHFAAPNRATGQVAQGYGQL